MAQTPGRAGTPAELDWAVGMPSVASMEKAILAGSLLSEVGARMEAKGRNGWRQHKADWLLGTKVGQSFLLSLIFVVLLFSGSVCWWSLQWSALEDVDALDPGSADTFLNSMWITWGLLFDPGTQTGVSARSSIRVKMVAWLFSVLGFVYFLTILGIVVDGVRSTVDYSCQVRSRVVENNHTLILGWGNRTLYLLTELLAAYDENRNRVAGCFGLHNRYKRIVILAKQPKMQVDQEISMHFLKSEGHGMFSHIRFIEYREGDPTDQQELQKVSASSADDILIMRDEGARQTSDTQVVQCCLALNSLSRGAKVTGEVFAEIQNPKNLELVSALHADGVVLRQKAVHMLCHQCLHPAVGQAIQEMLSFTTCHLYVVREVPDQIRGMDFLEARAHWPGAVLIGAYLDAYGQTDSLIFIARSLPVFVPNPKRPGPLATTDDVVVEEPPDPPTTPIGRTIARASTQASIRRITSGVRRMRNPMSSIRRITSGVRSPLPRAPPSPSGRMGSEGSGSRGTTSQTRPAQEVQRSILEGKKKVNIFLVGSPSDIHLHIWSLFELAKAQGLEQEVRLHILWSKNFKPTSMSKHYENHIHWYEGDSTEPHALKSLPLQEVDSILVLAYKLEEGEPAATTDARSLSTVFQLRGLRRKRGLSPVPMVCELWDISSRNIVDNNDTFMDLAVWFHSVRVETALFATAADDTSAFNTLMHLVDPNGTDLVVMKVSEFDEQDEEVTTHPITGAIYLEKSAMLAGTMQSYWTLQNHIAKKNQDNLLIGWKRPMADDEESEEDGSATGAWELNPADKDKLFKVDPRMSVLFLKASTRAGKRLASKSESQLRITVDSSASVGDSTLVGKSPSEFRVPTCL